MTLAEKIMATEAVENLEWVTATQIAEQLGARRDSVRAALSNMVAMDVMEVQQDCAYRPAKYRKIVRHWINSRPLADTSQGPTRP